MGRVVVVNPGVPELVHAAAGLARAGQIRMYIAPFAGASLVGERSKLVHALPARARGRILQEFRKRRLPEELLSLAQSAGTSAEVLAVLTSRLSPLHRFVPALLDMRNSRLQTVARRALSPDDDALLACYSAGGRVMHQASQMGIRTYLDFPTVHPRFERAILDEERRLDPSFARALPWSTPSEHLLRSVERELALAHRILVMSSFQRQTLLQEGIPAEKLTTIPLGVDLDLFQPGRNVGPKKKKPFTVMYVGRVSQHKGLAYLLDGFKRAAIPNSELVFVGGVRGDLRSLTNAANVRYLPALPRYELPAVYARADVYVLPSLHEGFPMTALEAMACGVPAIVSTNTFGSDVIVDGVNGYIVPIRDSQAISERLQWLHDQPELRRSMAAKARSTAEGYSWDLYGRRIAALIAADCP